MSFGADGAAHAWRQREACALCGQDGAFQGGWLGDLTGPWGATAASGRSHYVHRLCALWSPEVRCRRPRLTRSVSQQ